MGDSSILPGSIDGCRGPWHYTKTQTRRPILSKAPDVMSPNANCYGSSLPRHCGRHQTHQQKREGVDAGTLSPCSGTDCCGLFCHLNRQYMYLPGCRYIWPFNCELLWPVGSPFILGIWPVQDFSWLERTCNLALSLHMHVHVPTSLNGIGARQAKPEPHSQTIRALLLHVHIHLL